MGQQRGKLKIFLGYAAGVGKTYQMLQEAQDLKSQGVDIVVGYFEPHGRKDTIEKTAGLTVIPRKKVEYRGAWFEEMDTEAILARRPRVCVVDEYPHTNVPGSERTKRWEDVELLLDSGIDVLTTMNIQHLESLNDHVRQITGVRVRETIPDWVVEQANEVVMVDVTPRALLNRLERGVVYAPEKAGRALENFFQETTLVALRELAMRQTAHEVEHRGVSGGADGRLPRPGEQHPRKHHKVLVLVTKDPETAMLIRRARRVSDFLEAECFAVAVQSRGDASGLTEAREAVERHLNFARNLHIETRIVEGEETASALVEFSRQNQITQIFLARPRDRRWASRFGRDLVQRVVGLAKDMQVVIVSEREPLERRPGGA